jgi:hypothetical protein
MAAEHGATTILIEDVALGMNLLQDLRANLPSGNSWRLGRNPQVDANNAILPMASAN